MSWLTSVKQIAEDMAEKPAGQVAYEAYCETTGGKSLASGAILPAWNFLSPQMQFAWKQAAAAVVVHSVVRDALQLETGADSNLVRYARQQLEESGWFDPNDGDYGGKIGPAVLEIVQTFAKQGHSGGSQAIMLSLLERLLSYKPIAAIRNPMEKDEYIDHSEISSGDPVFQSTRISTVFTADGGKTWYDLDRPCPRWKRLLANTFHFPIDTRCYIKFPYLPK